MAAAEVATPADQAASYGWSLAVINSNPELKALFAQATTGLWTADHFVAKVRDTKWFKTTADTARQTTILRKADPATYNARINAAIAQTRSMAGTTGTNLSAWTLNHIATESVMFGWNTDQLRFAVGGLVKPGRDGQYSGAAANTQYQYNQIAGQYGVTVSPWTMNKWVKDTSTGNMTADGVKNWMVANATSRYPSLKERLAAGETVQSIADPYIQSYAKLLEVNPTTVKLSDKLLQSALSGKDAKGQATTKSVWEFEQDLRNDPRYMKTDQARTDAYGMARRVLTDMGLKS